MKVSTIVSLLLSVSAVNAYSSLTQQQAQTATNQLWDRIRGPGECLFSKILQNAPSQNLAALWLRATFHDAGEYVAATGAGGLDGSLTLASELSNAANAGIAPSLATVFVPADAPITKADVIALGGIITVATCGGPKIAFQTGRQDATAPNNINLLPSDPFQSVDAAAAAFARMGLSKLDMLVLTTGSHTLGGAHAAISPLLTSKTFAPFDKTPGVFDNDIFKQTLAGNCLVPLDCKMAADATLRPYVQQYANDQNAFFAQYSISFAKLLALTGSKLSAPVGVNITVHTNLVQEGTFPTPVPSPPAPAAPPKSTAKSTAPPPAAPKTSSRK
ncbi:heme peroxidase [Rhizoclosmatium globosum]|uniref:Peroxidase n=1 Tax=Rhizoclosmatium globosum TaxID=329046 RepID=A0A1Y2CDW4_9FUNG|nr:heme peroxidase [Rhizoclosmatium globosum]|eukprot:ORY44495.1 heme peroxidase [Rhizoclosmatium globosum]